MSAPPTLALLGATGRFADAVIAALAMREDRWGEIRLLSTRVTALTQNVRSVATPVDLLTPQALEGVDIALLNLHSSDAQHWAQVAREAGAVVIDAGPTHRLQEGVPLVVPDVNPEAIAERPHGIIALPGPITWSLIDAAHVLHEHWGLRNLVVTAMVAAAFKGEEALQQLAREDAALCESQVLGTRPGDVRAVLADLPGTSPFPGPLSHNVIPWVGVDAGEEFPGSTSVEIAVAAEVRKVLALSELPIQVTCVQVPVAIANALSIVATCERRLKAEAVRRAYIDAPAIVALDDAGGADVPTPVDAVGSDPRFLGRIRVAPELPHVISMFIAADTIRRGATALVQAAELLTESPESGLFDDDRATTGPSHRV